MELDQWWQHGMASLGYDLCVIALSGMGICALFELIDVSIKCLQGSRKRTRKKA